MTFKRCYVLVGLMFAFLGCSEDRGAIPVTGIVTYKEKPIGRINVMFVPEDKEGIIAQGTSDENGKFVLQTIDPNDGAIPGKYRVAFKHDSEIVPDMPGFAGGVKPEKSPIPLKYADDTKSGFTATVDKNSSKNDFKFDLK